jgi:hypothetical protein
MVEKTGKSGHGTTTTSSSPWKDRLLIVGGVFLPLAAVLFETSSHFCAKHFFDPFPSCGHVMLFLLIPLSNALVWFARYRDMSQQYGFMALASGMAAGIGLMYTLMFLPVLGLSLLFVFAGTGLLGLSPVLSLPCTLHSGKTICNLAHNKGTYFDPHQAKHIGHLIVLVMVVAVELPSTLTRLHLNMADNQKTAVQGIRWLRKFGNPEVMLRACYERSGRATDIVGSLYESARPLSIDHARAIYYRVTGKPFNSVPIPASARATMQHAGLASDISGANAGIQDEFDLDADIAGEVISGVARGLSVRENSCTGSLDPDALVGNLSWTITFDNASRFDREARLKLLLPRGAAVNDAFLELDNRERRAAIMVRNQARTVYVQAVASKRKSPLLVSASAPDQVLIQCFPVSPGHPVKVRLSMVCPLLLASGEEAVLGLPTIIEKNFRQDAPLQVDVQWSGTQQAASGRFAESVDLPRLNAFKAFIRARRDCGCRLVYCRDDMGSTPSLLAAAVGGQRFAPFRQLFIVVDGSRNMSSCINEVAEGLKRMPFPVPVELKIVGDETRTLFRGNVSAADGKFASALETMKRFELIAGQDDSPDLLTAISKADQIPGAAVLWIHGAQPVHRTGTLKQYLQKNSAGCTLYDLQVEAGPVEVLSGLIPGPRLVRVPRMACLSADLSSFFDACRGEPASARDSNLPGKSELTDLTELTGQGGTDSLVSSHRFAIIPAQKDAAVSQLHECNGGLAQLYAYDQILRAAGYLGGEDNAGASGQLATSYHLVSPVSSAVVADLDRPPSENVATAVAPEADFWILLIIAGAMIGSGIWLQRRQLAAGAKCQA